LSPQHYTHFKKACIGTVTAIESASHQFDIPLGAD